MTIKIRKLRKHPLLESPGEVQSPWEEIEPENIPKMIKEIMGYAEKQRFDQFTEDAVAMQNLGIDLSEEVAGNSGGVMGEMLHQKSKDLWHFASQAANMKKLGFDVKGHVESVRDQLKSPLDRFIAEDNWWASTVHAANMKRLGLNPSEFVEEHSGDMMGQLEEYAKTTNWLRFTQQAVHMTTLGIVVGESIEKERGNLLAELDEYAGRSNWWLYTKLAGAMAELGILTPKPDYPKQKSNETPPLRKFA